jgi:hypothetical protein
VRVPRETDRQLGTLARLSKKSGRVKSQLVDPGTYQLMQTRVERRLQAEKSRLQRLGRDLNRTFDRQRGRLEDLGPNLKRRLADERLEMAKLREEWGDVMDGKHGNFFKSAAALGGIAGKYGKEIFSMGRDIVAQLQQESRYLQLFARDMSKYVKEVNGYIDGFKDLIENPGDALMETILGPNKQLGRDIHSLADEFGMGEPVADFFGLDDGAGAAPGRTPPVRPPGGTPPPGRTPPTHGPPGHTPPTHGPGHPPPTHGPGHTPPGHGSGVGPGVDPVAAGKGAPPQTSNVVGGRGQVATHSSSMPGGKALTVNPAQAAATTNQGASAASSAAGGAPTALPGGDQASALAHAGPAVDAGDAAAAAGAGSSGSSGIGPGVPLAAAGGAVTLGAIGVGAATAGGGGGEAAADKASQALSRAGGLAPEDVYETVSHDSLSFLQTPGEGQLMVVPTEGAQAIDNARLSSAMVDAQMDGVPVGDAVSQTLSDSGYVVYQRGWGDYVGEFVQAAVGVNA